MIKKQYPQRKITIIPQSYYKTTNQLQDSIFFTTRVKTEQLTEQKKNTQKQKLQVTGKFLSAEFQNYNF